MALAHPGLPRANAVLMMRCDSGEIADAMGEIVACRAAAAIEPAP
jgi:hypothetical protein